MKRRKEKLTFSMRFNLLRLLILVRLKTITPLLGISLIKIQRDHHKEDETVKAKGCVLCAEILRTLPETAQIVTGHKIPDHQDTVTVEVGGGGVVEDGVVEEAAVANPHRTWLGSPVGHTHLTKTPPMRVTLKKISSGVSRLRNKAQQHIPFWRGESYGCGWSVSLGGSSIFFKKFDFGLAILQFCLLQWIPLYQAGISSMLSWMVAMGQEYF